MNTQNFIKHLEELASDTNNKNEQSSRRESILKLFEFSKKVAIGSVLPGFILSGLPKKSLASSNDIIIDVLNFALTLEYLESSFYDSGVSSGIIPASDIAIFQQIMKHEDIHVTLLKNTITSLGGTPVTSPGFDFTAGGAFNPFVAYGDFLALSQSFEDTGVRAYKGQAPSLMTNNGVLTVALQIHSVEARHASEVRRLRNKAGLDPTAKGWITEANRGTLPEVTQAVYNGEDNLTQGGVNVTTITNVSMDAITEAFDEPLDQASVLAIAGLFIV